MRQVAQAAGVSQPTVSHVLNERREGVFVSEETRRRVLQTAQEMGYRRNHSARAMATGRFGVVAMLLSTHPHSSSLPQRMWEGIHDELSARDMTLTVARLPDEKLSDGALPKILREWMADGLLVDYTDHIPQRLLEAIREHALPAVWLNAKLEANCVHPDDYGAGRRAAEHLLKLGHRRVLYLDLMRDHEDAGEHYSARDRASGFGDAMRGANVEPRSLLGWNIAPQQRLSRVKALLAASERPTAIAGYGGVEMEFALLASAQLGLQVPRDVSLLTFGSPRQFLADLHLCSFTVPEYEVGREATRLLLELRDAPGFEPRALAFGFDEGASCALLKDNS